MASPRVFKILTPQVLRPYRGATGHAATITEPTVVLPIVSDHLQAKPIDYVHLTEDQALALMADLSRAVRERRNGRG